jgi:hypothetical protein
MQKTQLLPVYSIMTNMVNVQINQNNKNQVLVTLATGKILSIECDTQTQATLIHTTLHYYPAWKQLHNNSREFNFSFTITIN